MNYSVDANKLINVLKTQGKSLNLFRTIKETNGGLLVTCPYHKQGQESHASCLISLTSLYYHCFTCGAHGHINSMLKDLGKDDIVQEIKSDRANTNIRILDRNTPKNDFITKPEYTIRIE